MLTPYQFASNRVIDGINLDGLEYYSPMSLGSDLATIFQAGLEKDQDKKLSMVVDHYKIQAKALAITAVANGTIVGRLYIGSSYYLAYLGTSLSLMLGWESSMWMTLY